MPIDPNSETSDIGMMYRQYLLSKGMPLTNENMQTVIAQSQREPGMIAGLGVQQSPQMSASPPPNIAGASRGSSIAPPPLPAPGPPALPQQALPIPPQAPPHADPASAPITLNTVSPSAQATTPQPAPQILKPDPVPQTPPPGQAPGPQQVAPSANGLPPDNDTDKLLAGLGVSGAAAWALKRLLNGGDYARQGSVPQNMVPPTVANAPIPPSTVNPAEVAAAVNKGSPITVNTHDRIGPPEVPGQVSVNTHEPIGPPQTPKGPSVGESSPSVAAAIEKPKESPVAAAMEKAVPSEPKPSQRMTTRNDIYPPSLYPAGSAAFQSSSGGKPAQGPPDIGKPRQGAPVPASLQRQMNTPNYVQGVEHIGIPQRPPMQGPPTGPHPMQGPPTGPKPMQGTPGPMQGPPEAANNTVTADSILENILHPKLSTELPRVGNTVPSHVLRGARIHGSGFRLP